MADELIGKVVNGYEVLRLVGQGGMARVYLARQQSMDRQVALKVLPLQFLSDDTYLQRFDREVKIVSQLEHAHIVPVYDYGEYDGQPFIAMRYMPNGSVDDRLAHGALDNKTLFSIISQIAPALDYAHSKGVLHRDLKPSNVLMDETGNAYLTDFGIARLNEGKGAAITTQGVVGTPSYMSPEQAQGKELDGRSDIYSLGVMLFELATGRRPFESETPYSIAVMQVTTPPPNPRMINPAIAQSIEKVILKALRKNPAERYQTGHELVEALKASIEHPETADDTDLKINVSALNQQLTSYSPAVVPPSVAPASPVYAQPPVQPMYPNPSQSYSQPIKPMNPGRPPKNQGSPMTSILIGGGIGCLFLVVIAVIGVMALPLLLPSTTSTPNLTPSVPTESEVINNSDPTEITPTTQATTDGSITQTATLDPTSESARATLLARQMGATMTGVAPTTSGGTSGSSSVTTPVGVDVSNREPLSEALSAVSGTLIYADQRGDDQQTFEIMKLNLSTWVETQLTADNADNSYPVASPDGRWIAFQSDRDGDFEIYVMNTDGGQLQQVTNNAYLDRLPAWSPDGEWIIYSADVRGDGTYDLYRSRLDGTKTEVVLSNTERKSHARYSPDGRYIVFTTGADTNDAGTWEIAVLDTTSGEVKVLTNNTVRDATPSWSPDGKRIIYITYLSASNNAIAQMNADGSNQKIIYDDGLNNWTASYSPDGAYIVFTQFDGATDQLYLMTADGESAQRITQEGGNYASWIP